MPSGDEALHLKAALRPCGRNDESANYNQDCYNSCFKDTSLKLFIESEVKGSSNSMNVYLEGYGQIIHFAPGRSKNQASFIP